MRAVIIIDDATTLTEIVALALASARTDGQTIVVPSRQEGSDRPRDADWSALILLLQELGLTLRECDVVIRDLQGFSRAEIAAQLHAQAARNELLECQRRRVNTRWPDRGTGDVLWQPG
jgi:hypothetical protein